MCLKYTQFAMQYQSGANNNISSSAKMIEKKRKRREKTLIECEKQETTNYLSEIHTHTNIVSQAI